jgi:hypothetical protein
MLKSSELAAYHRIHLVGHSHGGNIATRSALLVPGRVSSIVPFIRASERTDDSLLGSVIMVPTILLTPFICFILTTFFYMICYHFPFVGFKADEDDMLTFFVISLLCIGVMVRSVILKWAWNKRRQVFKKYRLFGSTSVPTLPIYYQLDEAYISLRYSLSVFLWLIKILNRIKAILDYVNTGTFSLYMFFIVVVFAGVWLVIWMGEAVGLLDESSLFDFDETLTAIFVTVVLCVAFAVTQNFLLPFLRMLFSYNLIWLPWVALGPDGIGDILFVHLRILKTPEGGDVARPISPTLPRNWRGRAASYLRHSQLCFDEHAILATVDWIKGHMNTAE